MIKKKIKKSQVNTCRNTKDCTLDHWTQKNYNLLGIKKNPQHTNIIINPINTVLKQNDSKIHLSVDEQKEHLKSIYFNSVSINNVISGND